MKWLLFVLLAAGMACAQELPNPEPIEKPAQPAKRYDQLWLRMVIIRTSTTGTRSMKAEWYPYDKQTDDVLIEQPMVLVVPDLTADIKDHAAVRDAAQRLLRAAQLLTARQHVDGQLDKLRDAEGNLPDTPIAKALLGKREQVIRQLGDVPEIQRRKLPPK